MRIIIEWPNDAPSPTVVRIVHPRPKALHDQKVLDLYRRGVKVKDIAAMVRVSRRTAIQSIVRIVPPDERRNSGRRGSANDRVLT